MNNANYEQYKKHTAVFRIRQPSNQYAKNCCNIPHEKQKKLPRRGSFLLPYRARRRSTSASSLSAIQV